MRQPLETEQELRREPDAAIASFVRDSRREKWFHRLSQPDEALSHMNRNTRLARFEEARTLHQTGLSMRTVAHATGMSRETVTKFVQAETFPEQAPRPRKRTPGKLDAFLAYLLKRWQEGEYNGTQLYREIAEQGYTGSRPLVALFIADLRRMHPPAKGTRPTWVRKDGRANDYPTLEKPPSAPPPKRKRLTPNHVAWLFVCRPEKLTERQQKQVDIVCQAGNDFQQVYTLAQDFVMMLTQQNVDAFDGWLQHAEQSSIVPLKGFAKGLRQDYAAVRAALTLIWSNGQTEGQVHRLKLIKRLAYGRASFDLLRLRVLHGSGHRNHQKCV